MNRQGKERKEGPATAVGGIAILLWALLALFTTGTQGLPPLETLAFSFAVAFLCSLALLGVRGQLTHALWRHRPINWILGVGGLFGYHFFYFVALKNAPPADASLIAYLWPLLIVLFSGLLPGQKLHAHHLAGALMGLAGAGLLVTKGAGLSFDSRYTTGYVAAMVCALTWSGYSVLNRRYGDAPTELVGLFCGAVAFLGLIAHLALETTVTPTPFQALSLVGLGLGPVGAAFFVWDYGTKHGNLPVLGALSYAAPLLSTILLVAVGAATATWTLAAACALIVLGAATASLTFLRRTKQTAA
jgi:drug/metabolite transporter (DMT)-like permease